MSVSLFAIEKGYLDDVPVNQVRTFEHGLQDYMQHHHAKLMSNINETGDYSSEIESQLHAAVKAYKETA